MTDQQPEARDEIRRLEISAAAGHALIREILEALCRRDGLPLESSVVPGEPAQNYDLALRLGIGGVFGVGEPGTESAHRGAETHAGPPVPGDTSRPLPSGPECVQERAGASSPDGSDGERVTVLCPRCLHDGVLDAAMDRAVNAEHAIGQVIRRAESWQMQGGQLGAGDVAEILLSFLRGWTGIGPVKDGSEEGAGHG